MSFLKDTLSNLKREREDVEEDLTTEQNGRNTSFASDVEQDPLMTIMDVGKCDIFVGELNVSAVLDSIADGGDDEKKEPAAPVKRRGRPKKIRLEENAEAKVQQSSVNKELWTSVRADTKNCNELQIENVVPKCKGPVDMQVKDPLMAWHLLVDDAMLGEIVRATNEKIKNEGKRTNAFEKTLTIVELRAFIGLCYLCGVYRHTPELCGPLDELWTVELGNAIFRATMSLNRFKFLSDHLSFSFAKTPQMQHLRMIRGTWEKFINNCRSYYAPSTHCIVEEHIIPITDRVCPFQQKLYSDDKASGLRLVVLVDAKTSYLCNGLIEDAAQAKESDVLQVVGDIKGTHRNVFLSERYTSIALVRQLAEHELTSVGPLAISSNDAPKELTTGAHSRLYCDGGLTAIKCAECTLLTSIPPGWNAKELYESVNAKGRLINRAAPCTYSTCQSAISKAQRWPLQFFHGILDYAAHNAWLLLRLSANGNAAIAQRDFKRMLGLHLTQSHLRARLYRGSNSNLTINLKLQISELLGESTEKLLNEINAKLLKSQAASATTTIDCSNLPVPENLTLVSKHNIGRARCRDCPRPNQNKTRLRCQQCARIMCNRHLISRCSSCTGVEIPETLKDEDIAD